MDRQQKSDEVKTKTVLLHQVYREESAIMLKKRKHLIKIMALFLLIIFGGNMKAKAATFCNIENSTPKKIGKYYFCSDNGVIYRMESPEGIRTAVATVSDGSCSGVTDGKLIYYGKVSRNWEMSIYQVDINGKNKKRLGKLCMDSIFLDCIIIKYI